jgi:hypothetical protein
LGGLGHRVVKLASSALPVGATLRLFGDTPVAYQLAAGTERLDDKHPGKRLGFCGKCNLLPVFRFFVPRL